MAHAIADVRKTKAELIADNALLRQQLIVASRQAGQQLRLVDAISERVAELPESHRWLLDLVAVAGTPLPQHVVQAASALDTVEFRKHAAALRSLYLVRTDGPRHHAPIEPYHDHVRQAVLAAQDASRRIDCHARLAAALQATSAEDTPPEIVLVHLEDAGQRAEAARFAEAAARRADKALSFDLAAKLYATAIRLGEHGAEDRLGLLIALAEATEKAGRQTEAARIFLEAAQDAAHSDALDLRRRAAESFLLSGRLDEGVDALRQVLVEVGLPTPRSPAAALRSIVLQRAMTRLRGLRYVERQEELIDHDELRRLDACWSAAVGFGMTDAIQGLAFQQRHLRLALQAGEPVRVALALAHEALCDVLSGPRATQRAQATARRALELAEGNDSDLAAAWAQLSLGMSHYQIGEFAAALPCWDRSRDLVAVMPGHYYNKSCIELYGIWASYYLGRWRDVAREVPAQLQNAREHGDLYSATNFACGIPSAAWLIRGQASRAHRLAREHAQRWSRRGFHLQHYWQAYALAQAALYDRDVEAAWQAIDAQWSALRRSMLLRITILNVEGHDLRARCALALAARCKPDDPRRPRLLREAARCTRKVRRTKLELGRALDFLVRAGIAAVEGRTEASVELLRAGIAACDRSELTAHAAFARWRLAELLGGDDGAALMRQAQQWVTAQEVVKAKRMLEIIVPGFARARVAAR